MAATGFGSTGFGAGAFGSAGTSVQSIVLTSIATSEAFGTLSVNENITLTSIPTIEAFGTIGVALNVALTSISSAEAFGVLTVSETIALSAIPTAESFGTLDVASVLRLTSIPTVESFGMLEVHGPIMLTAIPTSESFGTLTVTQNIALNVIPTGESFGTIAISKSIQTWAIQSAEAFGHLVVRQPQFIALSSIPTNEAFGRTIVETDVGAIVSLSLSGPVTGGQRISIKAPGLTFPVLTSWSAFTTGSGLVTNSSYLSVGASTGTAFLRSADVTNRQDATAAFLLKSFSQTGTISFGLWANNSSFFRASVSANKPNYLTLSSQYFTVSIFVGQIESIRLLRVGANVLVFVNNYVVYSAPWDSTPASFELGLTGINSTATATIVRRPVITLGDSMLTQLDYVTADRIDGLTPPSSVTGIVPVVLTTVFGNYTLPTSYTYTDATRPIISNLGTATVS